MAREVAEIAGSNESPGRAGGRPVSLAEETPSLSLRSTRAEFSNRSGETWHP